MFFNSQPIVVEIIKSDSSGIDWSLILSIVAIIGAIVSFLVARWQWKKEFKQKEKEFEKNIRAKEQEIYGKYVEVTLEKKLESYQRLLKIIRNVGLESHYNNGKKEKYSSSEQIKNNQKALKELLDWEHEEGGFFLLSGESYERFRHLKKRLSANPDYETKYSKEHLQRILKAVVTLRVTLFKDLYIYHIAEENIISRDQIDEIVKNRQKEIRKKI